MRSDEAEYCRRRALQEQLATQKAVSSAARQRHDELATMYSFRARLLAADPETSLKEYRTVTMAGAE
ncbi:MAG TPA: hypothetical protein VFZ35_07700 [Sphingomicrobium sp.]